MKACLDIRPLPSVVFQAFSGIAELAGLLIWPLVKFLHLHQHIFDRRIKKEFLLKAPKW